MPPDLRVTWTDLALALGHLDAANRQASSLPRTSFDAFEQLDMRGSRTASATAELLTEWGEGLEALAEAGRGLHMWLTSAMDWLRELDAQLAVAAE